MVYERIYVQLLYAVSSAPLHLLCKLHFSHKLGKLLRLLLKVVVGNCYDIRYAVRTGKVVGDGVSVILYGITVILNY